MALYLPRNKSWWRHQMETFSALLATCAGNSPVTGEFPAQRPVTRSFDVFFGLRLNKRLSKQWRGWWFETPSSPLWRRCNFEKYIQMTPSCTVRWNDTIPKIRCDIWMKNHRISGVWFIAWPQIYPKMLGIARKALIASYSTSKILRMIRLGTQIMCNL